MFKFQNLTAAETIVENTERIDRIIIKKKKELKESEWKKKTF